MTPSWEGPTDRLKVSADMLCWRNVLTEPPEICEVQTQSLSSGKKDPLAAIQTGE